jgi:hypothetical protein
LTGMGGEVTWGGVSLVLSSSSKPFILLCG